MHGWYPDPAGAPERYRYWDGSTWSAETTGDPREPAPGGPAPRETATGGSPPETRRRRAGVLVGVLVLVVLVLVVAVVVNRVVADQPIADGPLPTSTVSGWDDSSPTATPNPTARPSASTTPKKSGEPPPLVNCPQADPDRRSAHPVDNRVYGGNLSFPRVNSFQAEASEPRLSFAWDVTQQYLGVSDSPGWIAQLAVGRLDAGDGFVDNPKNTAESAVECVVTSSMYELDDHPVRRDLRSAAITISGHQGWLIESNISVTKEGLPFEGDHIIVAVVPNGNDWGLFFGAVPIGNAELAKTMTATVTDLRAD